MARGVDHCCRRLRRTARQAELVDAVAQVQLELRTMRINRANFEVAAQPFDAEAKKLQHQLVDRWMRGPELQAGNDIGYTSGTLQRAENHFESIEASAQVHQIRELKKINKWQIYSAFVAAVVGLLSLIVAVKALFP
jgi:hypothetical protein